MTTRSDRILAAADALREADAALVRAIGHEEAAKKAERRAVCFDEGGYSVHTLEADLLEHAEEGTRLARAVVTRAERACLAAAREEADCG